jgi:predicted Zn-dependent peptidase
MESVGGDLNAFTGKEETVYYCTCLKQHLSRAIDILVDIVLNSTYPQHEMDKEVEVVASEIESYNDSPGELIYDEFENLIFNGHPLGRSILGNAERLREYTTEDIVQYVRRQYVPANMVLFVYGQAAPKQVVRLAEKALRNLPADNAAPVLPLERTALPEYQAQTETKQMDTHQAHVMMGRRAYGASHRNHLAMFVLNHILGGPGMNSRLSQSLREKNGLVYTVESTLTTYTDTGVWAVYFGCDPNKVERCRKLVLKELARLAQAPLSPSALLAVKKQIKGQIGISYDNFENVAIGMGKRFLHYNKVQTREEISTRIDALTAEDLWQTAREMFVPEELTMLIYK